MSKPVLPLASPPRYILKDICQILCTVFIPVKEWKVELGEKPGMTEHFAGKVFVLLQTGWDVHPESAQHDGDETWLVLV